MPVSLFCGPQYRRYSMGRSLKSYLHLLAVRLDNSQRVHVDSKNECSVCINYAGDTELYKLIMEMRRTVLRGKVVDVAIRESHDRYDSECALVFKMKVQRDIFIGLFKEAAGNPGVDEYSYWIMMAFKGVKSMCSKVTPYSRVVKVEYGPFPEVIRIVWKMHDVVPHELSQVEEFPEQKVAYLTFRNNASAEKLMKYFRKDRQ